MNKGLSKKEWEEKLEKIGKSLKKETRLTIMGSGSGILSGQNDRTSMDLDVWKETSDYDKADLKEATEKAGLLFNPTEELDPDIPYIQIVEEGICQLGKFKPRKLDKIERLKLEKPPAENLIASKLLRAAPKDIEDITFLYASYGVTIERIKKVIKGFPRREREIATENLVYIRLLKGLEM